MMCVVNVWQRNYTYKCNNSEHAIEFHIDLVSNVHMWCNGNFHQSALSSIRIVLCGLIPIRPTGITQHGKHTHPYMCVLILLIIIIMHI